MVEVEVLPNPDDDKGWTVLATTVSAEVWTDAEILQAYQEQHTAVEPGFCWIKTPAAIRPVQTSPTPTLLVNSPRHPLSADLVSAICYKNNFCSLKEVDSPKIGSIVDKHGW